jgi:uncharacterized protein
MHKPPTILPPQFFETEKGRYLYDPGSGEFLRLDQASFETFRAALGSPGWAEKWTRADYPEQQATELSEVRRHGFLRADQVQVDTLPTEETVRDVLCKGYRAPTSFVIEITDECNLRCAYCCFSGRYPFARGRGNRVVSRDLLTRAMSWYLANSDPTKTRVISFYGGEPLLHYELLLWAIYLARAVSAQSGKLRFRLTTNGTLLTSARARELLDHRCDIAVSLDGDEHTHDRNRFDSQGRGSFSRVIENLHAVWETLGAGECRRIFLLPHLSPGSLALDLYGWEELMRSRPFLRDYSIKIGLLSVPHDLEPGQRFPIEPSEELAFSDLALQYRREAVEGKVAWPRSFAAMYFEPIMQRIHTRQRGRTAPTVYTSGCCVPGATSLFLNIEGCLFPCEKVDSRFSIGSLDKGVSLDRVEALASQWRELVSSVCGGCWALRFCGWCLADLAGAEDCHKALRHICAAMQRNWSQFIAFYLSILDENPGAFEHLNPRTKTHARRRI